MYTAYTLSCPADVREIVLALLAEENFDSFEETEDGLVGYALSDDHNAHISVLNDLSGTFGFTYSAEELPVKNWNEEWERQFDPIVIDRRLRIRASFHVPDPSFGREIVIDPKMSFGTGHHATTHMMCSLLLDHYETHAAGSDHVLDYGCGTGVLAILAKLLGAATVDAVDIEAWAVENSAENAAANRVRLNTLKLGTLADMTGGKPYDLVAANINRNVLMESAGSLWSKIRPGGRAYLSGILMQDEQLVIEAYEATGFRHLRTVARQDWRALELLRE